LAQNEELGRAGREAGSGRGPGPVTHLILKHAWASRPSDQWNNEDYDVLADGAVVGRIFQVHAAPRRNAVDVDIGLRASRGSHSDTRLCRDPRSRDGGIRQELE
jgi:hypothetical protein